MNSRIFYHARLPKLKVECEHCGKETVVYDGLKYLFLQLVFIMMM